MEGKITREAHAETESKRERTERGRKKWNENSLGSKGEQEQEGY